ncbi:MAG: lipopolysaccharide assembly protein LapB [Pseudomonadota bacterium]
MDFDFQWLLLGLPIVFGLGWVASRFDLRQWRKEQRDSPKAYFKGLNFLLNEQHDKAIDAFIEAVQHDPETTDLHFALGNLFRRRGEYERAVRVHQHLLNRADLSQAERERAQHALAQDFLTAGLFDRAEQAWHALEGTAYDTEARLALLTLQERSRDWQAAVDTAQVLERSGIGSYAARIAHYWCELAHLAEVQQEGAKADEAITRAREASPLAARPLVLAGHRAKALGAHRQAMQLWAQLSVVQPASFNLVARVYAETAVASQQQGIALEHLETQYARAPSIDLLDAMALVHPVGQTERLIEHLKQRHSLSAARALLALTPASAAPPPLDASTLALLQSAVGEAAKPLQRYRCAACGFEAQHYFWQCPGCLSWDSFPPVRVEEL